MNDFSMESILFKNIVPSSNISNIKTSKSIDECVYDAYKSEEELKFYETYTMINDYNTKQKLRMLNKLRNTTNRIHNTNINNSCESYIRSIEENEDKITKDRTTGFMVRIWEAIKTFCRRIVDAIANLIKYIGNFISGVGTKKQEQDYQIYIKNQAKIDVGAIDRTEADNHGFTISYGDINKFLLKVGTSFGSSVTNIFSALDVKAIMDSEKTVSEIQNYIRKQDISSLTSFLASIDKPNAKEFAENLFLNDIKKIFDTVEGEGNKPDVKKAIETVFYGQTKSESKTTCGDIRKMSGNFECLSYGSGIIQGSKKLLTIIKKQQQAFTKLTKVINNISNKMIEIARKVSKNEFVKTASAVGGLAYNANKDAVDGFIDDKLGGGAASTISKGAVKTAFGNAGTQRPIELYHKIQNALSTLTNGRIRYNSKWTSLGLSVETMCLKYNKMVHSVLKQYISGKTNNVNDSNNDENDNGGGE